MTFTPCMAEAVILVKSRVPSIRSVIEFGNQTYTAQSVMPADSTIDFYKKLGIDDYRALDVNTRMGATIADLNYPVHLAPADLVTNDGTGEHIFDQASVFWNIHNLCKPGGVILQILPMSPWVNHGFYNYNPILFRDIAAANGYEWLYLSICNRWKLGRDLKDESWVFVEKHPTRLIEEVASVGGNVFIASIWRKPKAAPFKIPIQGKYVKDVEHPQHPEARRAG